jgi:hypothetical protein
MAAISGMARRLRNTTSSSKASRASARSRAGGLVTPRSAVQNTTRSRLPHSALTKRVVARLTPRARKTT